MNTNVIHRSSLALLLATAALASSPVMASPILPVFQDPGWTQFQVSDNPGHPEDYVGSGGYAAPGWGGQAFDAEYLFYQMNGTMLSIGLQTGFDIFDGRQKSSGKWYYTGDIALSFDNDVTPGDGTSYEYGIDFGLRTRDYDNDYVGGTTGYISTASNDRGVNAAGLYSVNTWNNDVVRPGHPSNYDYTASNPFAIEAGTLIDAGFSQSFANKGSGDESYYRIVTFDMAMLDTTISGIDVHWTMSCGNDAINGHIASVSVPAPSTYLVFGLGLIGLLSLAIRRG